MTRLHALSHAFVTTSLLAGTMLTTPAAYAQQGPPATQQTPQMQRSAGRHGGPGEGFGMGIVPPGTWWKRPEVIAGLNLTADQQKRLDDIFQQSRISLIQSKAALEEEQVRLEPMLNANPPDSGNALSEISKIADMRASLEKETAKMLLSLRSVLTAEQWTKLQAERHEHYREGGPDGQHGSRGHNGPGSGPNGNSGGNPPPPPPQD